MSFLALAAMYAGALRIALAIVHAQSEYGSPFDWRRQTRADNDT